MGDFDAVVGIDPVDMLNGRHDFTVSGVITAEFIGVKPTGFAALAFDQAAKEPNRGFLIASPLHENINGVPILIDRTPEILMLPVNGDDDFIQMPGIAQLALPFFQFARIGRAKLQAPAPYRFVGHDDATFGKEFFDFTKAQTESMIQPHSVTDNFGRESVALVTDRLSLHAGQSAKYELT